MNPHDVTAKLEAEIAAYTGAPYCVAVNSCTAAILLACTYVRHIMLPRVPLFNIPRLTYVGVGMSIVNARCDIAFRDEDWQGEYELQQMPPDERFPQIWDAARRFTSHMFNESVTYGRLKSGMQEHVYEGISRTAKSKTGQCFQCVSFHVSKTLGHSQGGALLHNVPEADTWLRRARFDGRTEGVHPKDDTFDMVGHHCYLSPDVAAALRWKLSSLPRHNPDLPRSDYSDLSLAPIFGG